MLARFSRWGIFISLLFKITVLQFFIATAWADQLTEDAIKLRKIVSDFIQASSPIEPKLQAQEMRKVISNHPEILQWVLERRDLSEIIERAKIPNLPATITSTLELTHRFAEKLKSQEEILTEYLPFIRPTTVPEHLYKATTHKKLVKKLITLDSSNDQKLLNKMKREVLIEKIFEAQHKKRMAQKLNHFEKISEELVKQIPDRVFTRQANKINTAISEAKFSENQALKMIRDPKTGFDMKDAPPKLAKFFDLVISQYFDKLALEDKRQMAMGILELEPDASNAKLLSSVLNNSGPALQKLFQLFGKDAKSPVVSEVMEELKANIKPFDSTIVRDIIEKNYDTTIEDLFSEFREKPLAAASVGQVHLARLQENGQEVILKIMRPGIEAKAEREIALLKSLAPDRGILQIVNHLEESLMEELDFRIEALNMEKGKVYNSVKDGVFSVRGIPQLPTKKHVMAMEKAQGRPISKEKEKIASKAIALGKFLKIWFNEAMFGGGFFHGDLHAGNIFFESKDKLEGDDGRLPDYKLTAIDFGSSGQFSFEERKLLIKLILGAHFDSPSIIMSGYSQMHPMTLEQKRTFAAAVDEILFHKETDTATKFAAILSKAIDLEFNLPKNFVLFNRGRLFLEKQIADANIELDKVDEDKKDYPRLNPADLYADILSKSLLKDMIKSLMGHGIHLPIINWDTISDIVEEYYVPVVLNKVDCAVQRTTDHVGAGVFKLLEFSHIIDQDTNFGDIGRYEDFDEFGSNKN